MENPLVSIIIPVFNGGRFLKEAIDSVLAQTYKNLEIVVVDDGSTDDSAEIAKSFEAVNYYYQPNAGVASARNKALSVVTGQYISFLDADDRMHKHKIQIQLDYLLENNHVDVCLGHLNNFIEPEYQIEESLKNVFLNKEKITLITAFAHRACFDVVGNFNTSYRTGSDFEWMTRVRDSNLTVDIIEEIILDRRIHGKNLSVEAYNLDHKTRFRVLRESMERKRKQASGE